MNKKLISLYVFFVAIFGPYTGFAADNAVDASIIFDEAEALQTLHENSVDTELVKSLNDLGDMVNRGRHHLLNQDVKEAVLVAERVAAQMELVKVLARLVRFKEKLENVQKEADALAHKKAMLQAQFRRLLLLEKGRALTGAFPAPKAEGVQQ